MFKFFVVGSQYSQYVTGYTSMMILGTYTSVINLSYSIDI